MRPIPLTTVICLAGALLGLLLFLMQDRTKIDILAITLLAISVMGWFTCHVTDSLKKVNRPADEAFDQGFEMGHDAGYLEGRRVGRPTTVLEDRRKANGA